MIPYEKMKTRLKEMIYSAFLNQNRTTCYKFIILGIIVYFVNELSLKPCYTNEQVISKLEFSLTTSLLTLEAEFPSKLSEPTVVHLFWPTLSYFFVGRISIKHL